MNLIFFRGRLIPMHDYETIIRFAEAVSELEAEQ